MDVTDKESIANAVKLISKEDGKLDVLINKLVHQTSIKLEFTIVCSAGQEGPKSIFFSDPTSPERKDTTTLGTALFKSESFQGDQKADPLFIVLIYPHRLGGPLFHQRIF